MNPDQFNTRRFSFQWALAGCAFLFCGVVLSQEFSHRETEWKNVPEETIRYVEKLIAKGLIHRDQIKSGQMDVTVHLTISRNGKFENERTEEIFLAFDEERQRADSREVLQNNPYLIAGGNNIPRVSSACIGCCQENNQLIAEYSRYVRDDDPTPQSTLSIYDTGLQFMGIELSTIWTEQLSYVPRYIASFYRNRLPTKKRLEDAEDSFWHTTVGKLDSGITDVTITEEEYKGAPCKKITLNSEYTNGAVSKTFLWIAEKQGHALRKFHAHLSGNDIPFESDEELLEVDVALDKESGIWFPTAWHYERNIDGKPRYNEDGTVKNVVLNKPIPEKIFTLKDIKTIPAGVMVQWRTERFPQPYGAENRWELIWDGNNIVTRSMFAERLVENMIQENKSNQIKKVVLVNAAGISLILALLLWRYYQHLKRQN
jgi:hypothetical protein